MVIKLPSTVTAEHTSWPYSLFAGVQRFLPLKQVSYLLFSLSANHKLYKMKFIVSINIKEHLVNPERVGNTTRDMEWARNSEFV